jgi:HEAT repeat protein
MMPAALVLMASSAFAQQSDETIRAWVQQLGAMYEAERTEARKNLAEAGASAEKRLVEGLDHADHRVRRGCLELLTMIDAPSGVDRASALFRSKTEDRWVQGAAFEYLKKHPRKAEDVFIDALDNAEESVRLGAIDTLIGLSSEKALPAAAARFEKEPSKVMKDRTFTLMKSVGDPARPHLLKFLASADALVRQEALASLIDLKTPPADLVEPVAKLLKLDVTPEILTNSFEIFARAGAKATPHILEGLKSNSPAVRTQALAAVTKERTEGALEGVADLYSREANDAVRAAALDYLVDQGLRAEPALIKALESSIAKVRMEAISALGRIKSEKVYDRVSALYKNEKDPEVRRVCFEYLETVGIRAQDELIATLKDEDVALRRRAIRALGLAGSEKAIGPIVDVLNEDPPVARAEAIDALASIGEKAVEFLREAVKARRAKEEDSNEVAVLFNQVAVERVLDAMITKDGEGESGTWAGQFEPLAKLGKERVLPVLWKMAAEPDYALRFRDPTKVPRRYPTLLQCLAILAIGDLGDAEAAKKLKDLTFPAGEDRHLDQLVALYRLGDKGALTEYVDAVLKEAKSLMDGEGRMTAYRNMLNAAILRARAGMKEEALKTYGEVIAAVAAASHERDFPDVRYAHYNSACLLAGMGKKAEAVAALGAAIEAGWVDYEWIFRDKELDPIRGEEGYRKLTEEAERSRRK